MSKLIFQISEELQDNKVYDADVLHITNGTPSPYPDNCFIEVEDEVLTPNAACENNTPKYTVKVKAIRIKDALASHPDPAKNNKFPLFTFELMQTRQEKSKQVIESDERYLAKIKEKRKAEFEKEVDALNYDLLENLATAIIANKVTLNGKETKDLAQLIVDKKTEIRNRVK